MITRVILLYFLITTSNVFGQTIQELEYDLSIHHSSETYGNKIEKAKELQEVDPFNYYATRYICRYYSDRKIDSVSVYFDNLITKFPESSEPYLLRSEFFSYELDYYDRDEYSQLKVKYLIMGLDIKPKDHSIVYKLAEAYYQDFIFPLEKERDWGLDTNFHFDFNLIDAPLILEDTIIKKSTFEHSADSSLKYFYQLWNLDKEQREVIYYPIRQLECYLHKIEKSQISRDFESSINQCYFPSYYFANLEEKWECNFTTDYLFELKSGKRTADWLEIQLKDLDESCLFTKVVPQNSTIYRFTWLRSFHHPIAIRLEKNEDEIVLFWKVGKGAGGYEPQGLKTSRKEKISLKQWEEFEKLLGESNFDNLPNEEYIPMSDGAGWTMERKTRNSFKAHKTNSPSKQTREACLYLIHQTKIKVKNQY